jgi:hypothetical protein
VGVANVKRGYSADILHTIVDRGFQTECIGGVMMNTRVTGLQLYMAMGTAHASACPTNWAVAALGLQRRTVLC